MIRKLISFREKKKKFFLFSDIFRYFQSPIKLTITDNFIMTQSDYRRYKNRTPYLLSHNKVSQ